MSLPNPHPRWAVALTLLGATIPAVFLGSIVARYGVEVPMLDDWEMAPLIAKAHTGALTWNDLFAQQEEARTIVPKLIFILCSLGGYWDVRQQMMLSVAICALTAAGLYVLLRRTGLGFIGTAVALWLSVLLIFSPMQFELWLFASGFPSFMPALFIVAALVMLETRWRIGWKFAAAAVLAALSTFTLAHGLLAWALTFPCYLAANRLPHWKRWAGAWLLAAGVCAAAYFYGYRKPAHLPEFGPAVSLLDYAQFFLAFLGGGFAYASREQPLLVATAAGAVLLALFLGAAVICARRWQDQQALRRTLPWFALGMYSLGSAALATLGRIGFGLEYAISSRYVTFSLYLAVAVVALVALGLREVVRAGVSFRVRATAVAVCLLLGAGGVQWYAAAFGRTLGFTYSMSERQKLGRAAIVFSRVLDSSAVIQRHNYPAPELAVAHATMLDDLGLLRPRLVRTADLAALEREENGSGFGVWEESREAAGQLRASGWAVLPGSGRTADAVLLAHETREQGWRAVALSDAVVRRRDVARRTREPRLAWSGWSATLPRDAVPAETKLSAWAVDAAIPKLYRLQDSRERP